MPINELIARGGVPLQFENPMNQLAKVMQMTQAQQETNLGAAKLDEYQRSKARSNRLIAVNSGLPEGASNEDRINALRKESFYDEADKLMEGDLKRRKIESEATEKDAKAIDDRLVFSRKVLDMVKTPDQFMAWHQGNHSDPIIGKLLGARGITAESARTNIEQALTQPGGFENLLKQAALGADKFIEMNKPTYQTIDRGNTKETLALPGLGGPVTVANTATVQQSPDNAATNARAAAEGAANRGNSMTIANMADARSRDANTIKAGEKKATDDLTKGSQLASFDTMLGTLDRLSAHPGLTKTVGLRSVLPTIPGGDSANFQAELNTFQSQAFIPMVAQLKGMGALSDAEGKKLTQAVGALDPKMGEKAFRESITRIKADMNSAYERVSGKPRKGGASADWNAPTSGVVDFGSLK